MAKGRKTGGRNFKPGNNENPLGGAAHCPELKRLRRATREEIAEIGTMIVDCNRAKLIAIRDDPNSTVLKVWMASIAIRGINKGDPYAMDALLNRTVGKVKEEVKVTDARPKSFEITIIDGKKT